MFIFFLWFWFLESCSDEVKTSFVIKVNETYEWNYKFFRGTKFEEKRKNHSIAHCVSRIANCGNKSISVFFRVMWKSMKQSQFWKCPKVSKSIMKRKSKIPILRDCELISILLSLLAQDRESLYKFSFLGLLILNDTISEVSYYQ